MEQKITGFYRDEQNHWVATLACGHTQHVRHNPPWQLRPWVETDEGRAAHIGRTLECKKCGEADPLARQGLTPGS